MSDEDTTHETEATEAEEQQPADAETEAPEAEDGLAEVDLDEAANWDPERALKKIRKLNNEVRTAKKRAEETSATATSAAAEAREARALVAREKVARRLNLADNEDTDEFLGRLKGDDVDELMQDAERLLSLIAGSAKKPPATRRPAEALRGGGAPNEEPEETDISKLGDRMFRR